ncbi:DUF2278 family protein [uncultured Roseibium sp.]|uniref:DUF2278 family protein n=1 Tax=uncultured Roseibium sp. TaxID=1936171 RepID=UPI002592C153|nr:DUF2278 family protein [uncultured Roseibium sp.]
MPLTNYTLLKGRPSDYCLDDDDDPHIEIRIEDGSNSHRIALNVRSIQHPHDLLYALVSPLEHPGLAQLKTLPAGMHDLKRVRPRFEIDYIRGGMVVRNQMRQAPFRLKGPENDLRDYIEPLLKSGVEDPSVTFYAIGERWGPEPKRTDKYFGFRPGSGIHEVHMNQGSRGGHAANNGVGQDGALLIHFGSNDSWAGIFLGFQSQAWVTHDRTGHPQHVKNPPKAIDPLAPPIAIVAAMINPTGREIGRESVTLLNRTDGDLMLNGWQVMDDADRFQDLSGRLPAGEAQRFTLEERPDQPRLPNKGGTIRLIAPDGTLADEVVYEKHQAAPEGWTTIF